MGRTPDPRKHAVLGYLRSHPLETYGSIEARFGVTPGLLAVWVGREKAKVRSVTTAAPPAAPALKLVVPPEPGAPKPSREGTHKPLRSNCKKPPTEAAEPKPKTQPNTPPPVVGSSLRKVPQKILDRHRSLIDKQLLFMETHETGSKEYMNAHTVYRGLLADWQSIPQIDEERSSESLPDLSTEEGRAQVASDLAGLPEDVLEAAMAYLKEEAR